MEEFENRFSSRMYAYHRVRLYSSHYNHFLRLQCTQLDKKIFLGTVYSLVRYDFIAFGNLLSLSMLYFLVYTHGLQMDRRRSARLEQFTMGPNDFVERKKGRYRESSPFAPLYVLLHYIYIT